MKTCPRCHGQMWGELIYGTAGNASQVAARRWTCLQCGEVVESYPPKAPVDMGEPRRGRPPKAPLTNPDPQRPWRDDQRPWRHSPHDEH